MRRLRRLRSLDIDLLSHNSAAQAFKPTPWGIDRRGERQYLTGPKATDPELGNKQCPDSKARYAGVLHIAMERQTIIKTQRKFVRR